MGKILPQDFFDRSTIVIAKDLLGKDLVRRWRGKTTALMVTEVEAYDGPRDRASHASRGITPRTKIMFGEPGKFYVYFTYGMHWLVNIVTGPKDYPAAVLLRAGVYRDPKTGGKKLINGPARLAKFLKIDGALNGKPTSKKTGLWFEDRKNAARFKITAAKRIGVDYAGPIWGGKKWNFKIDIANESRYNIESNRKGGSRAKKRPHHERH
jgi:DNA-3-methyladenine glycosylase